MLAVWASPVLPNWAWAVKLNKVRTFYSSAETPQASAARSVFIINGDSAIASDL
jgi:hypothetical protein